MRTFTHLLPVAAFLVLAGCTGAPPAPAVDTDKQAEPAPAPKIDTTKAEPATLVPSPLETQRALKAAGIETALSTLIGDNALAIAEGDDKDKVALRTGVVIARMLLTVKTSTDEQLVGHLDQIKAGMAALDGGDDIDKTLDDLKGQVTSGSANRDTLLKDLDELSGAVIPELEFNGQERVVPLIQAGSWLEGSSLVAKAIKASGNPATANDLLKQPMVVDYFAKYVKTEGADKAPAAVTQKLDASLATLKGLAVKTEAFSAEDIDAVIKTTADVLALL